MKHMRYIRKMFLIVVIVGLGISYATPSLLCKELIPVSCIEHMNISLYKEKDGKWKLWALAKLADRLCMDSKGSIVVGVENISEIQTREEIKVWKHCNSIIHN